MYTFHIFVFTYICITLIHINVNYIDVYIYICIEHMFSNWAIMQESENMPKQYFPLTDLYSPSLSWICLSELFTSYHDKSPSDPHSREP